jgi:trigger factor
VQLDIEVEQDRVQQSLDAAYRRLAPRAKIPGFRPGKAPRAVTEKYLGRDRLMNEALDKLLPDVYNEALESEDIDAIAQPQLDGLELDPVRFKFVVPVRPSVDLGDYRSLRVEKEKPEVTQEQVGEQLKLLQRRNAVYAPVDRGIQWTDMVIADVAGKVDDEPLVSQDDAEFSLREGETLFVEGLAEAFLGMKKGEDKTIDLTLPEDFRTERFQGKTATFTLHVKEVKEEDLPEIDDDLAQQINAEEFETIEDLTERIRHDLQEAADNEADAKFRQEALRKLIEGATVEYPRVLVDQEIDHMVRESTGGDQKQYVSYLQSIGRSDEEFREVFRGPADERVRRSIVLIKLAEDEGIHVTQEDIDAELERIIEPFGEESARFREIFNSEDGRATIRRDLLSQRTLERLSAIASGEAPEKPAQTESIGTDAAESDDTPGQPDVEEEPA